MLMTPIVPATATPVLLRPSLFSTATIRHEAHEGQSIADMLRACPELPPEIWSHGIVRIGGWDVPRAQWVEIPREHWERVRHKPGPDRLIDVSIRFAGGGEGGGKSILGLIASIALLVIVSAVSGGALAGVFGTTLFAAGSTSAALAAAGIAVVGSLAINALTPPPVTTKSQEALDTGGAPLGSASIQGNVLEPFAPIPFVMGTHRVAPPHLIAPWSEAVNDDQFVYAIVGLNGPHAMNSILLNNAPIDSLEGVEYEVRDIAITGDVATTLIDKQVWENQVGGELTPHKVQDNDTDLLQDVTTPANSYPQWQSARSRTTPEEIWITLTFSSLVFQSSSDTLPGGVPIRIRVRRVGDVSWVNLPEFIATRERLEPFRGLIKIVFDRDPPGGFQRVDQDTSFPPWASALYVTNAVNAEGFDVNSYFTPVADKYASHVGSANGVATVYLNPAVFLPGTYDVEVKRGFAFNAANFSQTAYTLSGGVPNFFSHTAASSPPSILQEQSKVPCRVSFQAISSVWNEPPLQGTFGPYGGLGLSLIAIKAKNIAIQSLTVLATGYAPAWNGSFWGSLAATRNPAAWGRHIALGGQSIRAPYVVDQLDDESIADWFNFCDEIADVASTLFFGETLGGTVSGWTSRWASSTTAVITANAALAAGKGPLFARSSSDAATFWSYDAAGLIASVDVVTIINVASTPTGDIAEMGIITRGAGAAASETGYRFALHESVAEAQNRIQIGKFVGGVFTQLATLAFSWSLGTNYYMRVRSFGTFHAMKVWRVDAGFEPVDWMLFAFDGAITAAGRVGATITDVDDEFYLGLIAVRQIVGLDVKECNAFITGQQSAGEIMRLAGAAGHAAWRASDKVGVIIDRDRTAETPTQLFTQRNTKGLTIRRAFPRIPHGFRVRFNDEANDFLPKEIFVYRAGYDSSTATEVEAVSYVGITNEARALARAQLDFASLLRRASLYDFQCDVESLYCIKGSLVALTHDTIARHLDAARVVSVQTSGPNVTGLTLDCVLRLSLMGEVLAPDDEVVTDPDDAPVTSSEDAYPAGLVIQLKSGTTIVHAIDQEVDASVVTFTTPFTIPADGAIDVDCLVASGPFVSVRRRMVVLGVKPQNELTASVTLIDEAEPVITYASDGEVTVSADGHTTISAY